MKNIFHILLLLPTIIFAQYPSNNGQKITLGEQTTADGLVYRGVASIDTVTATSKITRANKQDTSAYLLLDTVTNLLWHYKIGSNAWTQAGGSTFDTTTLNLASRFGLKLNISDTSSMLTNYYSAGRNGIIQAADVPTLNQNTTGSAATLTTGRTIQTNLASTSAATFNGSENITPGVTGILPLGNGGTGSATQNFVDLSTNQTVNGIKTFKDSLFLGNVVVGKTRGNNTSIKFGIDSGLGTADRNVAIGYNTLQVNTGQGENVAIGYNAGKSLTTGVRNMLLGFGAGEKMTAGASNVAFGATALFNMITGGENVAVGRAAIEQGTTLIGNVAIGQSSLYSTSSDYNTGIGYRAGWANSDNKNTTGTNNTFIGNEAVGESSTASNHITLGNSSITKLRCTVNITTYSDGRDKTDILPLNYGMNFIDKLKPVSFVWDMRDGGKIGIPEIGFIAQDLQQAQIDSGINVPNLVSGTEEKLDVTYNTLLPIIVKALQEANEKIKSLEQRIINLENK